MRHNRGKQECACLAGLSRILEKNREQSSLTRAKLRRETRAALHTATVRRTSRSAQEEQQRRLLYLLCGGLLGIVFLIIGVGYYVGVVRAAQKPVLIVGDEKFTANDIARRARGVRGQSDANTSTSNAAQALQAAVELLEREAIVRQGAREMGITATADQIEAQLHLQAGVQPNVEREVFVQHYRGLLQRSGLSDAEYRRIAENHALQQLISTKLLGDVAPVQPQVHIRVLQLLSEEAAKNALQRLEEGLPMELLARSAGSPANVDRGWIIRGQEERAVEEVAFSLKEGERSGVIQADNGAYYIIEVVERDDQRPVEPQQISSAQLKQLDLWIRQRLNETTIVRNLDMEMTLRILKKVES